MLPLHKLQSAHNSLGHIGPSSIFVTFKQDNDCCRTGNAMLKTIPKARTGGLPELYTCGTLIFRFYDLTFAIPVIVPEVAGQCLATRTLFEFKSSASLAAIGAPLSDCGLYYEQTQ